MKRLFSIGLCLYVLAGALAGCAPGMAVTSSGAHVTERTQASQTVTDTGVSGPSEFSDGGDIAQPTTESTTAVVGTAATPVPYSQQDADAALDMVMPWFEEPENRIFEVDFPVTVEGLDYYKITVSGIAGDKAYPIDMFAIRPDERDRYYMDSETGEWVMFINEPTFACATSPDGKLRAESVGMWADGPSGLFALREMRIIDIASLEPMWGAESFLMNSFRWSPDGRYVCAQYSGRTWTETLVVDTADMSATALPGVEGIRAQRPDSPAERDYRSDPYFEIGGWVSDTAVRISFRWSCETCEVLGEYEYDVPGKTLMVLSVEQEGGG